MTVRLWRRTRRVPLSSVRRQRTDSQEHVNLVDKLVAPIVGIVKGNGFPEASASNQERFHFTSRNQPWSAFLLRLSKSIVNSCLSMVSSKRLITPIAIFVRAKKRNAWLDFSSPGRLSQRERLLRAITIQFNVARSMRLTPQRSVLVSLVSFFYRKAHA